MSVVPYVQGFEACLNGESTDDNPYELATMDGELWMDGFSDAEKEGGTKMKKLQINGHTIAELPNSVADALMELAAESGSGRFDKLEGRGEAQTLSVEHLMEHQTPGRTAPMSVTLSLYFDAPQKEEQAWKPSLQP